MSYRICLAEDDPIIATVIEDTLRSAGHEVVACEDGAHAWHVLQHDHRFDALLIDRDMPEIDGLALVRRIKQHLVLARIPVIMETGDSDPDMVRECIDAGAYYYLIKPYKPQHLLTILTAAVRDRRHRDDTTLTAPTPWLGMLQSGSMRFRTLDEARMLAPALAHLAPDPKRTAFGLLELFVNAVEHGNLGISYADKSVLMSEGTWEDEVLARLALSEQQTRDVEVSFERLPGGVRFTIRDQGAGFDWRRYLDIDPERAFDPHGRGIAMSCALSFTSVEYQGTGNTVVVVAGQPTGK